MENCPKPVVDTELWKNITKSTGMAARKATRTLTDIYPKLLTQKVKVLDVGCGRGNYLKTLTKLNPEIEAIGVDVDDNVIAAAKQNLYREVTSGKVKLFKSDFLDIPFLDLTDRQVDFVLLNSIMHIVGVEECQKLVKKSKEVLQEGGAILILEIFDGMGNFPFPAYFDLNMKMHHQNGICFRLDEMKRILEDNDFSEINYYPINQKLPYLGYLTGKKTEKVTL